MLYQMSITRFFTIYIAQGIVFAVFLYLAIKILRRDNKRLNIIFAGFYISPVIGFFINFLYGPMTYVPLILFLNYLTNFGIFYSPIFLVVFDLILLKSEKVINTAKQALILVVFGVVMFCMIFFIITPGYGVTLDENLSPVWSLPFFWYLTGAELIVTITIFYLSLLIYKKFQDETLKQKWKSFIYGFLCLTVFMYGVFLSNTLNNPTFRIGMGLTGIILAIISAFLIYRGVGRQLEK
jgi:hypothetical protein